MSDVSQLTVSAEQAQRLALALRERDYRERALRGEHVMRDPSRRSTDQDRIGDAKAYIAAQQEIDAVLKEIG